MADEDGFSLLGALAGDLADGLAQHVQAADNDADEAPHQHADARGSEPWRPRPAITRAERLVGRLSDEAHQIARDLLSAAGLVAAPTAWRLRNSSTETEVAPGSVIDVGRNDSRGATFLVDHPVVSRLQCRVELDDEGPSVANLGSVNPAFVRRDGVDSPIGVAPVRLVDGDAVLVGDDVLLFTVHEASR